MIVTDPREKKCIKMTIGARRQGSDVIHYSFKGKNNTYKPVRAQRPPIAMHTGIVMSSEAAAAAFIPSSMTSCNILLAVVSHFVNLIVYVKKSCR